MKSLSCKHTDPTAFNLQPPRRKARCRAGEMAPQAERLRKALSLDPQDSGKTLNMAKPACNLSTGVGGDR